MANRIVVTLWIIVSALGLGAAWAADAPDPDLIAEKVMAAFDIPGMAVAIVKDDKLVAARGYGVKEAGGDDPVTPETIFAIGSNSKSFTSAAVAVLVGRGELSWEDVLAEKLPGFRMADNQLTWEGTFRDHLSMRTGLGEGAGNWLWHGTELSRTEILHRARYLEPASPFRTAFGYSNISYLAVGEAAAAVAGMSWDAFVRESFFGPLGMSSSDTLLAELDGRDNLATPHRRIDGANVPDSWADVDNAGPAGSITSNVLDMSKWLRFQLGEGTFEGNTIIDTAVFREMHLPHTFIRPETFYGMVLPDSNFVSYGLGWFVTDITGRKVLLHGGTVDGMTSMMAIVPSEKLGVVILTNVNLPQVHCIAFLREYLDAAVADSGVDWVEYMAAKYQMLQEHYFEAPMAQMEALRDPDNKAALALEAYAGEYSNDLYGKITVTFGDGGLSIAREAGEKTRLEHWYGDTFRPESEEFTTSFSTVTFTNSNGEATSLSETVLGTFTREVE